MSAAAKVGRTAGTFALTALVLGGARAIRDIGGRTFVLDFQAGAPSSGAEKLDAILQSAAIEGLGFLAVGLCLSVFALALARALPGLRAAPGGSGYGAALILATGAFFGWVELSWIASDALAFLTRGEVLLLDAAGFLGLCAGLLLLEALLRLCPWASRERPATALAVLAAAALGSWAALAIVKGSDQGWRHPGTLLLAGAVCLAPVPLAALLARWIERPLRWFGARWTRAALLPRPAAVALWGLLAACVGWTLLHLELSPLDTAPSYARLPAREAAPGPNVVFVTVDTLRADHLGCYGYERPTSPFIDELAAGGARCADASASASWTKPATATILTGLYPSRHGALYHGSRLNLPEGKQTLAEAFQERGYVTAGFVANPNIKRVFGFDRGFDEYYDAPVEDTVTLAGLRTTWFGGILMDLLRHQFNWNYENDILSMNEEVLAWLRSNHAQRFFLYAHYIDPHIPYDPPARYREEFERGAGLALFNERKQKVGIDLYDGEIRYTDDGIAQLVTALRELGVWDETLFVFTSDHGEEFFEHGVLGHGFSLYQEVVHVPLILHGPGVPPGVVVEEPVQVLDLAATVLDLAGAGTQAFGDGRSFGERVRNPLAGALSPDGARPHFLESEFGRTDDNHREFVFTGLRQGPWKFVLTEENVFFPPSIPRFGREALYDLERDPTESTNLFHDEEQKARITAFLDSLREHAQFLAEQGFRDIPPAALTPEIEAGLRALGYIGGN